MPRHGLLIIWDSKGFHLELLKKIREKDKSVIPDPDIRRLQKQNTSFVPPLSL